MSRSLYEADEEWGTYEPFERIAGLESSHGVTTTGLEAAVNIAVACQKLTQKWIRYNHFSRRLEYLYAFGFRHSRK